MSNEVREKRRRAGRNAHNLSLEDINYSSTLGGKGIA